MTRVAMAVVLAGGEGRRMGGAKPTRRFGRTTLAAHALELARSYGADVAMAVRDAAQVCGVVDAPLLFDDPGIEGPLAALASALRFAQARGANEVLTLPCDSPYLPPDLGRRLRLALRDGHGVVIAQSRGRLHPVCALWRAEALDALPDYLATGRRSLNGFARAVGLSIVDWGFAHPDPFANANTPGELAALQPDRGMFAAVHS